MNKFPFKSLRDWLAFLDEKGQLVHNKEEVDLLGEIAAISRTIVRKKAPAVLHENIHGYPGWRIVTDTLAVAERVSWAWGFEGVEEAKKSLPDLMKGQLIPSKVVDSGPCKEVKLLGDDIDLTTIPIPRVGEFDIPPFITSGVSNVRDPETGWLNSGIRRFQIKGKQRVCNLILPVQQEGMIFSKYIKAGKPMPIAIAIGADPLYFMLGAMFVPAQVNEIDYWGMIAGEPLEVVKCETNDLVVPATSEIVIEGEVDPVERELEGPFCEFPGYYSGLRMLPFVNIRAITMRKDPIVESFCHGKPPTAFEQGMNFITVEQAIYQQVKPVVPELKDIHILSTFYFTAVASLDTSRAGELKPGLVKKLAMAIKSSFAGLYTKNLFIVDDDIDIYDIDDVLWAFSVRFQAGKDIMVISDTLGCNLDPSEPWLGYGKEGHSSMVLFDCTVPPPPYDEGYKRGIAEPPREEIQKVQEKWTKYGFK